MSRTTFSGPVASQNGFEAPTFTSTTLPYYTTGNIVYVSDLNTLAFGGVDQWYRQDTKAGLGTGGNVTPTTTTYTVGTDYNNPGVQVSSTTMTINEYAWSNLPGVASLITKPSGTPFTVDIPGYATVTGTLTSNFSGGAGSYFASISGGALPPGPSTNCDYITI